MSTKCTIKHGEDFHFYKEAFDEDHVYLNLAKTMWEAHVSPDAHAITVAIPKAIWAVIRESAPVVLKYAEMTDAELLADVERQVNERISEYQKEANDKVKAWLNFAGSLAFGSVDRGREQQVREGLKYFKRVRRDEKLVLKRIEKYNSVEKRLAKIQAKK